MVESSLALHQRSALPSFSKFVLLWMLSLLLAVSAQSARAQLGFDFSGGFDNSSSSSEKVSIQSQFTPATADRPALLFVTATISDDFHIFATDQANLPDGGGGPLKTTIFLAANSGVKITGAWQPLEAPHTHIDKEIWVGLELREHSGQVTWFAPIQLPANANPASLTLNGKIDGQACNENNCIPFNLDVTVKQGTGYKLPAGTQFTAQTSTAPTAPGVTKHFGPAPTTSQLKAAAPADSFLYDIEQIVLPTSQGSLVYFLISAFLGGIILNVMPCVLPVIGLKVMSFVQQAGQSRRHALILNLWYSAGIIFVFLILAGLAVVFQLGWGTQFSNAQFTITLIGIVFAMGLSLLGMWDIPIPGFVGSGAAVNAAEREGPAAAFLKGILTTVLATPCTGPFMGSALIWALRQPAWMTFTVFGVLGLGMASPYLLIGAYPNLVRFLPKPGAWMETFKKITGLILMFTVIWLFTSMNSPLVVPTIALLVGIALACWWIEQTPYSSTLLQKSYGWVTALLIVVITTLASYGWLYKDVMKPRYEKKLDLYAEQQISKERILIAYDLSRAENEQQKQQLIAQLAAQVINPDDLAWQSFSLAKLGQLTLGNDRTVIVDFTANWCVNCKALEKAVLKTQPVENAISQANVVTMEADWTNRSEVMHETIKALGGAGVPLIAIFPASDPYHPIVFSNGQYTQQKLIDAIAQATSRNGQLPDNIEGNADSNATLSQLPTSSVH